ncbi:hypothetical protein AO262_31310 [Pseudomonas fluorescens ABAC62]|nr:hypothetical protein AO262_31310 [Pseudomonas fluorescens ABAC62]
MLVAGLMIQREYLERGGADFKKTLCLSASRISNVEYRQLVGYTGAPHADIQLFASRWRIFQPCSQRGLKGYCFPDEEMLVHWMTTVVGVDAAMAQQVPEQCRQFRRSR